MKKKGFTLIELLLVITIIAILITVILIAVDPVRRLKDSKDVVRMEESRTILEGVKTYLVDNAGINFTSLENATTGQYYLITDGSISAACNAMNSYCDVNIGGVGHCVDITDLIDDGYVGKMPLSPPGEVTWNNSTYGSGYYLIKNANGSLTVGSCESENTSEINVTR